ncbi:MAG: hypothetical protein SPL50_02540 [Alloprevotella sp.]|nr:hypothetical protein [Alloprevotella sp.]
MNWFDKGYLPNLLWQQKYKFSPTFPHIYGNYFYLALYFYYYYVCNLQKINHKAVICRIFALGGAFFGEGLSPSRFLAGKERKDNGCKIAIVPPIGFSTP